MLVLSRKPGESVQVGDTIKVHVVRIGPNAVRLGFDAPLSVDIHREDVINHELRLTPGDLLRDLRVLLLRVRALEPGDREEFMAGARDQFTASELAGAGLLDLQHH